MIGYSKKGGKSMTFTSDVIKLYVAQGFKPHLVSGRKIVRLYICHQCKKKTMVKMYKDNRRYNACRCGYHKAF